MKCIFIYNPKSGNGRVIKRLNKIEKKLRKKFDLLDMYESKSREDLIEKSKFAAYNYDVIVFSGGDGTFNDVTNAVASCENRPILGYIPLGTANDIARNLKIPRTVSGALKVICNGEVIRHDVGMINDQYFIYVAGIGACTATSYTTSHDAKKALGRLAYARDGINEFFTAPVNKVKIISDEKEIETNAPLVLVLNSISVGGIPFNRYGHLNDGLFDIVCVNNGKRNGRFNILRFFIRGVLGFRHNKSAMRLRSSHIKIEVSDDVTWCIDGERGPVGSVEIVNLRSHLTILAPKHKARKQRKYNMRGNKDV